MKEFAYSLGFDCVPFFNKMKVKIFENLIFDVF